jgi:hypothetical protein
MDKRMDKTDLAPEASGVAIPTFDTKIGSAFQKTPEDRLSRVYGLH